MGTLLELGRIGSSRGHCASGPIFPHLSLLEGKVEERVRDIWAFDTAVDVILPRRVGFQSLTCIYSEGFEVGADLPG